MTHVRLASVVARVACSCRRPSSLLPDLLRIHRRATCAPTLLAIFRLDFQCHCLHQNEANALDAQNAPGRYPHRNPHQQTRRHHDRVARPHELGNHHESTCQPLLRTRQNYPSPTQKAIRKTWPLRLLQRRTSHLPMPRSKAHHLRAPTHCRGREDRHHEAV